MIGRVLRNPGLAARVGDVNQDPERSPAVAPPPTANGSGAIKSGVFTIACGVVEDVPVGGDANSVAGSVSWWGDSVLSGLSLACYREHYSGTNFAAA